MKTIHAIDIIDSDRIHIKMMTETYYRRPLQVEAVKVTEENILDVAKWCKGKVFTDAEGKLTLELRVLHPANEKEKQAHVGNWILKSKQGFKVYADAAFKKGFKKGEPEGSVGEALREAFANGQD